MIRVRFHGRGGHGVKTASRILGTAAFLADREVQDSPVYGAERRGAAVVSFTRIARGPIRERGVITRPTFIVVADPSLLEDAGAAVLDGQEGAAGVFVNSRDTETSIAERFGIDTRVVALDLSSRSLEILGRAGALSTGLAAAATRIADVAEEECLVRAVSDELEGSRLTRVEIEKNQTLAREIFRALEPLAMPDTRSAEGAWSRPSMASVVYEGPWLGSPTIVSPGNATARHTGAWRVERPEVNRDSCTRCAICFVRCPDGAIALDDEGYPIIDYDHCKGCMICLQECPLKAIYGVGEVRAW